MLRFQNETSQPCPLPSENPQSPTSQAQHHLPHGQTHGHGPSETQRPEEAPGVQQAHGAWGQSAEQGVQKTMSWAEGPATAKGSHDLAC